MLTNNTRTYIKLYWPIFHKCIQDRKKKCEAKMYSIAKARRVWSCKGESVKLQRLKSDRRISFAFATLHFQLHIFTLHRHIFALSLIRLHSFKLSPSQLLAFTFATLHFHIFALKAKMQRCKWFQWNTIVVKCQWNFFLESVISKEFVWNLEVRL